MEIIDPGHKYRLTYFDIDYDTRKRHEPFEDALTFVKREGGKYPGTITQEVLRALIDRTQYVYAQEPNDETELVLHHLRMSLMLLEMRAARLHGNVLNENVDFIENEPFCDICGHIICTGNHDNQKEEVTANTT